MKTSVNTKKLVHFNKWARKSFSIFNSLGKQIKICVLMICCSILNLNSSAFASVSLMNEGFRAEDEPLEWSDTLELEAVTIQAVPRPALPSLSRVVSSFQKEDLEALPVQDLQQVLQYVSSIDLRKRGGYGVQNDINIRGGSFDQVMILLNGVNMTDPQTGHHNLNLPVDLKTVERIEILQGPGARVLGPNAFGGAVNIVTVPTDSASVGLSLLGGQHRLLDFSGRLNYIRNKWKCQLSASAKSSDGYRENTDFDMQNIYLYASFAPKNGQELNFQSAFQNKKFGANEFYSLDYPNQYEHIRLFLNTLSYQAKFLSSDLQIHLYHRRHYDRFELFRTNPQPWYQGHNYHQTDVLGSNFRFEKLYGSWKTKTGVDARFEHIFSNVLGEDMQIKQKVPFENNAYYDKEKSRQVINWFLEQSYYRSKMSVSAGLMGMYSDDFGHFACFGTDFTYVLNHLFSLFASVNQSLRLPTFTDLYYSSPNMLGNPALKPERSTTFEIGSKYHGLKWFSTLSLFYRQGQNIIDWVKAEDDVYYRCKNHLEMHTKGVEWDLAYEPKLRFLRQVKFSYTFLDINKDDFGLESSKVLDYLKNKFTLSVNLKISKSLYASVAWVYQQRNGSYTDQVELLEKYYQPVNLWNAKLVWKTRYVDFFVDGDNIFNKTYFDFANIVQSGRWMRFGLDLKLNGSS